VYWFGGVVANAGGMGDEAGVLHKPGCTNITADNFLGHALLDEGLIKRGVSKSVMPFGRKAFFKNAIADCRVSRLDSPHVQRGAPSPSSPDQNKTPGGPLGQRIYQIYKRKSAFFFPFKRTFLH
jgi:hypothetical protein